MIPDFGPRYPFGHRLHHGLVGVVFVIVGGILVWDDRRDWPWRFEVKVVKKPWWQRLR